MPCPSAVRSRRGILLPLVLVFLVIAATLVFATSVLRSQVFDTLRRQTLTLEAATLAESAVDEAIFRISTTVNRDPADPVYQAFRGLAGSGSPRELALKLDRLPRTAALLAESGTARLDADEVRCRIVAHRPFPSDPRLEIERFGLVTFEATVVDARGGSTDRFAPRSVSRTLEMRMQLLSPPRPFDRFLMFLDSPDRQVNTSASSTDARAENANDAIDLALVAITNLHFDLQNAAAGLGDILSDPDQLDRLRAAILAAEQAIPQPLRLIDGRTERRDQDLHLFKFPLVMFTRSEAELVDRELQLQDLDLPRLVRKLQTEISELNGIYSELRNNFFSQFSVVPEDVERAAEAAKQLGGKLMDVVKLYKNFQDTFVELSGDAEIKSVAPLIRKLDIAFWATPARDEARRATWRFASARAFDAFLETRRRDGAAVNGVALIENAGGPPLVLGRAGAGGDSPAPATLAGRLVIVATGNVEIHGLEVQAPARHVVTVIAGGDLTLDGRIHACVIASGKVRFGKVRIEGSLVMRPDGFPFQEPDSEKPLDVIVRQNPAQESSAGRARIQTEFNHHVRVLFSPIPVAAAQTTGPQGR